MSVLNDDSIRELFRLAWSESQAGKDDAHEEGGFVLCNVDGSLAVERWPRGAQNEIFVPPHPNGKRGDLTILATFHTHPNPGLDYQQEPSLTDIRAVRDDPHLSHSEYEGEYVIAAESIYRIERDGRVESIGKTHSLLHLD